VARDTHASEDHHDQPNCAEECQLIVFPACNDESGQDRPDRGRAEPGPLSARRLLLAEGPERATGVPTKTTSAILKARASVCRMHEHACATDAGVSITSAAAATASATRHQARLPRCRQVPVNKKGSLRFLPKPEGPTAECRTSS
jgi:hypothetical protein